MSPHDNEYMGILNYRKQTSHSPIVYRENPRHMTLQGVYENEAVQKE